MTNSSGKKIALGAVIGVAAGYIAGILTAPKSGKETREDIKNASAKAVKEAEKKLKELYSDLDVIIDRAKSKAKEMSGAGKAKMDELIKEAQDGKIKAKEMLSAIRAGDATDPELKAAIDQASEAKNHLVKYLKQ